MMSVRTVEGEITPAPWLTLMVPFYCRASQTSEQAPLLLTCFPWTLNFYLRPGYCVIKVNDFTRNVVWFKRFVGYVKPGGIICGIRDKLQPHGIGTHKNG